VGIRWSGEREERDINERKRERERRKKREKT
jgi:hypothetical protein